MIDARLGSLKVGVHLMRAGLDVTERLLADGHPNTESTVLTGIFSTPCIVAEVRDIVEGDIENGTAACAEEALWCRSSDLRRHFRGKAQRVGGAASRHARDGEHRLGARDDASCRR